MARPKPAAPLPTRRPDALPALTGVRALAAGWVVALHLTAVTVTLFPGAIGTAFLAVARPGALGVDLFYVLSGFIISWNYQATFERRSRWRDVARFLWARLARIYPVHLAILIALVVVIRVVKLDLHGAIADTRWSTRGLVESLLLVHAWVGDTDVWNSVSWSISAEWFAYLLFPLYARAIAALRGALRARGLLVAATALSVLPLVHALIARVVPIPPVLPLLQVATEFGAGCLACASFTTGGRPRSMPAPGPLFLVIVLGAALLHGAGLPVQPVIVLVPPLLLGLAGGDDWFSRWLASPRLQYWGRVSFSLYMTHYLWLWAMRFAFPAEQLAGAPRALRLASFLAHLLPMLAVAALTHAVIEAPSRRALVRGRALPRSVAPGVALDG